MTASIPNALELLLNKLGGDTAEGAEEYEFLRQKLVRLFIWKGCPESQADALADIVLDRVAGKLAEGEDVRNLNAYAYKVMCFVWLEHINRNRETAAGDNLPDASVEPEIEVFDEPDLRLRCLRECVAKIATGRGERRLIIGYYDVDAGEKLKDRRKNLAKELGLTMINLKVKAYRLRSALEKCVNECVARLSVTERTVFDTGSQGGDAS